MLVLSRKSNESIVIGDQIVVEILEISNNKIRIGIAAPDHIRVVRGELTPKEVMHGRSEGNGKKAGNRLHGTGTNGTGMNGRGTNGAGNCTSGNACANLVGNLDSAAAAGHAPVGSKPVENGRAALTSGPLGKSRQRVRGGSENPNVRTVSDLARYRLRQLRLQSISESVAPKASKPLDTDDTNSRFARKNRMGRYDSSQVEPARFDKARLEPLPSHAAPCSLADLEFTGQEIAETASEYHVPAKQVPLDFEQRIRAAEDRRTNAEAYWQVAALNHYRNEWVAEEPTWYQTSELESSFAHAEVGR
ncbi:MAG: carbon storage regulator [Planctomycetaceae bacterium]|nr:carbon storage regulator [Planctomycetaceae bacterium]